MSSRKEHLAEMRYALANNCDLATAKRGLADLRRRAAEELQRERENRPVLSGRELERRRRELPENAPWMMRD